MTDHQSYQQPDYEQMNEEQRLAWQQWEDGARKWAQIQRDETEKAKVTREWKELGAKSPADFREFVCKQCGFDPGG